MSLFKKIQIFFQEKIWESQEKKPFLKNFVYLSLRVFISSMQGFMRDKGFDKASTLTFYSLLSVVPLVAISFGIAQELGFEKKFIEQVKIQLKTQPEVAEKVIEFSNSTLKTTEGNILAGFGFFILLWTVFSMIGNIASFFNEIWKVSSQTFWQQIKSFLPLIFLFPIFLVGSSSLIFYLSSLTLSTFESIHFLDSLNNLIIYFFNFVSYLIGWGFLSFIYIYLPNTQVLWKAGIIAGILTGLIFFIWQWIYVIFQVNTASYGLIYGGFAAIPLFLLWLNYSWLIIIFGAELTYQIQSELQKE